MGGRGSCYLNFNNSNNSTAGDVDITSILENTNEDKDTLKEYNGKTEKLKNKNIHIKESTDNLPEDVFIPNIKKIDHLTRKYVETSNILKAKNQEMAVRSDRLATYTEACFISSGTDFSSLQIVLNKDLKHSNRKRVEENTQSQIDSGYWMKSDKDQLVNQTITHEFGHYVQRVLMEKDKQTKNGNKEYSDFINNIKNCTTPKQVSKLVRTYSEYKATKYFKQIQRIHRKEFGKESIEDISRYGRESNREAFAELFANLNTCKNPTSLAKSMSIFLDKNFIVKGPKVDRDKIKNYNIKGE